MGKEPEKNEPTAWPGFGAAPWGGPFLRPLSGRRGRGRATLKTTGGGFGGEEVEKNLEVGLRRERWGIQTTPVERMRGNVSNTVIKGTITRSPHAKRKVRARGRELRIRDSLTDHLKEHLTQKHIGRMMPHSKDFPRGEKPIIPLQHMGTTPSNWKQGREK